MGKLRDRMRDDLRLRNYSERAIYGYLLYAKRAVAHFMKPPGKISRDEVRAYLLHLMNERGLSASTYPGAPHPSRPVTREHDTASVTSP